MSTTELDIDLSHGEDVDLSQGTTADIEYKIAASRDERAAAFRLVYKSYLRAGLGEPNAYQMRVTPYHLLPTTAVFIANLRGETIFTMSLIIDTDLGLPMEKVYDGEVAERRAAGLVVGEVSCLADRRSQFVGLFPVFLRLSRLMAQYARHQGLDQLLVAVHPRHARFYRRFMGFLPVGPQRAYPTVCDNPAVALCLDFAHVDRNRPECWDSFFGEALPAEQLTPRPITRAQQSFFRPMVDPSFDCAPLGEEEGCFARGGRGEAALCVA